MFPKRLDFLQAKEWFFRCFLRSCILGTFCRFIPPNLSRLSALKRQISKTGRYTIVVCCDVKVLHSEKNLGQKEGFPCGTKFDKTA